MSFLWNILFVEVLISSVLLVVLLYYVLFKKKEILSLEIFERIKESSKQIRIAAALILMSFFLFIIHEVLEVLPHFFNILEDQRDFLFIRHVVIYLPLIPFQAIVLSLILKAFRRT